MPDIKHAIATGAHDRERSIIPDLNAVRRDLERHRRFRVEQLAYLAGETSTGSDDALHEVTAVLRAAAASVLDDIDAALHRIELDCYGLCQRCNEAIPVDRLIALPMASLCMPCQYANETNGPLRSEVSDTPDIVEVWGHGSFPASDPPANW